MNSLVKRRFEDFFNVWQIGEITLEMLDLASHHTLASHHKVLRACLQIILMQSDAERQEKMKI